MCLKKIIDLFACGRSDKDTLAIPNEAPSRIDVTTLPLFEQLDLTVRFMVNQHQEFIQEHIDFMNDWIDKKEYNAAADRFIRLKWVDYLNPEIPKFEQNAALMSAVKTLPQQPDISRLHCSFHRVYPHDKFDKDMFELTDDGYKDIVTSPNMPNRAYGLGESWRTREKTPDDEKYYETAREIIFHYYLVGFDNVDHPTFKRPKKDRA